MYLKNIIIENNGPIERFELLEDKIFYDDGRPKPIILAGKNGTGKTIVLSQIVDALHQFYGNIYNDVLPINGLGKSYFRTIGGSSIKLGNKYCFSYLNFLGDKQYEYIEKIGEISFALCKEKTNNKLLLSSNWSEKENIKNNSKLVKNGLIEKDLDKNAYGYFPVNRFEIPHWMNDWVEEKQNIDRLKQKYSGILGRKLIINNSLEDNKNFLLDILLDKELYKDQFSILQWANINEILKKVLGRTDIRFGIGKRFEGSSRIAIVEADLSGNFIKEYLPNIDNLSSGQSILLNLFISILRISDTEGRILNMIEGIIIIDEIDAHLHIDLQREVLPKLIALFPKVQFIITSHSPYFLLGMKEKKEVNPINNDFVLVKMPNGELIEGVDLHGFDEIKKSYEIFEKNFKDYSGEVQILKDKLTSLTSSSKTLIITEGKTDWKHLKKAKNKLEAYSSLDIEFLEYENNIEMGDISLLSMCKEYSKLPQTRKIIFIFDRDNDKVLNEVGKDEDFKDWGNNVYSLAIKKPHNRSFDKVCIEHLYFDEDLLKILENRRLYLGFEFTKVMGTPKTGDGEWLNKFSCPNEHDIVDGNSSKDFKVYSSSDNDGVDNIALTKNDFANAILNEEDGFTNINFENFKLTLDIIKQIDNNGD